MFASAIKEIDAPELAGWISDARQPLRVIDVRQMNEIAMGSVPGAEPLPLHTLPARLHELSPSEKLVVICRSGARSAQACMFLQQQGFPNVYNLRGGMMHWVQSGFPAQQPG
ncbi:MAG: sulfurtransferase [Gallionellales bacterium GWA2_60_18]|nr:MAG: sulfurtransferase [Gallionellales bacterium GWA2_60_18]